MGFPWWPGRVLSVTTTSRAHVAWYASTTSSLMPCDSLSPFLEDYKVNYTCFIICQVMVLLNDFKLRFIVFCIDTNLLLFRGHSTTHLMAHSNCLYYRKKKYLFLTSSPKVISTSWVFTLLCVINIHINFKF